MNTLSLSWPSYQLFPYERELAIVEARALLNPGRVRLLEEAVLVDTRRVAVAPRLTYFRSFQDGEGPTLPTTQYLIESETSGGSRRQSTRYSVHGLHEYKGKFNPQVARALLNTACLPKDAQVLDPFCGSGTTLVECAHAGLRGVGTDINPLAAMISNAKAAALASDPDKLVVRARSSMRAAQKSRTVEVGSDARASYLLSWFDRAVLLRLEALRAEIGRSNESVSQILLVVVSNLLREFSLQEPADLRIRRRKSPVSKRDPYEVFLGQVEGLAASLRVVQRHVPKLGTIEALHGDIRFVSKSRAGKFHAAITSPPYAMALPYIDTQRLSLVWLSLIEPKRLAHAQGQLIGSREFNGTPRSEWQRRLAENFDALPPRHVALCDRLRRGIGPTDGFRRLAVPSLLYRYLAGMRESFRSVRRLLKDGAPYFLIVGSNHTVLGGRRTDIDTPELLSELAETEGFAVQAREVLQTYQRYGLHQKNAVGREELLTLRAV